LALFDDFSADIENVAGVTAEGADRIFAERKQAAGSEKE